MHPIRKTCREKKGKKPIVKECKLEKKKKREKEKRGKRNDLLSQNRGGGLVPRQLRCMVRKIRSIEGEGRGCKKKFEKKRKYRKRRLMKVKRLATDRESYTNVG